MKIKLFFLLDVLVTSIFSVYTFFLRGEEVAILTGLSIFIALFPLCLWLSEYLVVQFAKGVLSKSAIKVNNSDAIIKMVDVNTVAMPMNRFLTNGEYFITDLFPDGMTQSELLSYAASVEQYSSHSFGRLIYKTALGRGLKVFNVSAFQEFSSCGAEALLEKKPIRIGSPQWIQDQGVSINNLLLTKIDQLAVHGKTPLVVSLGKIARGIVALKDEINPDCKNFISLLKNNELEPVILTAANKRTASNFAKEIQVETVRTELAPDAKAREVQILRAKKQNVAMIGNEFHDLPAMFTADVSLIYKDGAMSQLSEDSDVKPDFEIPSLYKFFTLREIALYAARLIKINRVISYLSMLLLAVPALMLVLDNSPIKFSPSIAAGGVILSILIILFNSARMKGTKK